MAEFRPIHKEIEQDTLDIAKVFRLLSRVKNEEGKKLIDVYFTEQGIGYLNAMASLDPNLFVVSESDYNKLQLKLKQYELNFETEKKALSEEVERLKILLNNFINKKQKRSWWRR